MFFAGRETPTKKEGRKKKKDGKEEEKHHCSIAIL